MESFTWELRAGIAESEFAVRFSGGLVFGGSIQFAAGADNKGGTLRFAELARQLMRIEDDYIERLTEKESVAGRQASCKRGCAACCRQLVNVSPAEAWLLREWAERREERLAEELRQRCEQAAREAAQLPHWAKLSAGIDSALSEREHYEAACSYFQLGLDCPFLHEEECLCHPIRPFACREYLVHTPADHCRVPFRHIVGRLHNTLYIAEALAGICAHLRQTEIELIPLPLALYWAGMNIQHRDTDWDGNCLVNRFLTQLDLVLPESGGGN
jgi:Fe-S-cluster containining protein